MVPPPSQNTVGVCNQITLLILYFINYSLVTLYIVIDTPIQVYDNLDLTGSLSSSILGSRHSFFLFLKCVLAACLTLFRLSTLLWFGSCDHCILPCFLWFNKPKHSSSNHGFCCFNSYRPRFSLAAVLIFCLMFSQNLCMSPLSFKFSKAGNLFEILIWCCFLISCSLSYQRLNHPHQTSVLLVYLLPIFP